MTFIQDGTAAAAAVGRSEGRDEWMAEGATSTERHNLIPKANPNLLFKEEEGTVQCGLINM